MKYYMKTKYNKKTFNHYTKYIGQGIGLPIYANDSYRCVRTGDEGSVAGFFATIMGLFSYRQPSFVERGFELLEQDETTETISPGASSNEIMSSVKDEAADYGSTSDRLSPDLEVNLGIIRQQFNIPINEDIIIREFNIGRQVKAALVYIDGMVDKKQLNQAILPNLMDKDVFDKVPGNVVDYLIANILTIDSLSKVDNFSTIIMNILVGNTAVLVAGAEQCILLDAKGFEKRNVDKPITEAVVMGPQEAFTENLQTNITLVRKIVKNKNLVSEKLSVGKRDHSLCVVMYLKDVANPQVVNEVKQRISSIDADFVLGDGMLEQFISDNPLMLFPTVVTTERPDRTASFLMEGQVVIISEGSPFSMAVPVTFFSLFHTSEDSHLRWQFGTFLRFIRLIGMALATLLPGIYISVVLYHPEMIPTELLFSIAQSKENVPFPTLAEVMMMEISFELIREGGIRVPSVTGQTLGIIGALILGQAAVAAGLVTPVLIIVVSITGLGSFAIPNYSLSFSIRLLRFFFIAVGALAGFYGLAAGMVLITTLSCSMKSFGVPFLAPVAPKTASNPDVIVRLPIWMQKGRPDGAQTLDRKRRGDNPRGWTKPQKNPGGEGTS